MIGIDISKDKLDYCILNTEDHTVVSRGVIDNDQGSIDKWIIQQNPDEVSIALEHTGHYGALLMWLLSENDLEYFMITPYDLKRSMGIQRGKTDAVDAYRIASYAISQRHRLKAFELPTSTLRKLKALMTSRERFVKISVQLQNSVRANQILLKTVDVKQLIRDEKRQVKVFQKLIANVDRQMLALIRENTELQTSYKRVTKVIGVGPVTAIKCMIETNNFTSFKDARKFNCYCGLAPFPYQSGSSVKGRNKTHHLRNKSLKATLFKAAGSAIQHDPQLKKYYYRKIKEGKYRLSALNAVASKLVLRIFAVVHREEPFVKLSA